MIGPRKKTSDERMQIAHSIAQQVIAKYGANVRAIGIYGSLARKTDGPFSDIELKCGAMIVGLHHKQCYTTSAQVLPEALAMDDQPHGLKALAEMVMAGNLTNPQQIIAACENFWQTLLQWTAEKGYQIKCSKEIPW